MIGGGSAGSLGSLSDPYTVKCALSLFTTSIFDQQSATPTRRDRKQLSEPRLREPRKDWIVRPNRTISRKHKRRNLQTLHMVAKDRLDGLLVASNIDRATLRSRRVSFWAKTDNAAQLVPQCRSRRCSAGVAALQQSTTSGKTSDHQHGGQRAPP